MQVFKTRFTTDVSQHKQAMSVFKEQINTAVKSARNQLVLLNGLFSTAMRFKDVGAQILSLAADMEKTKVAFEVMLGSADKAKKVLGDLVKFADITPFDTAEIIQSGRALLACGTSTDELNSRLELLGNIAAGSNIKIGDMVAIYAKMANKGKVQTEELNQMAERGIPIYKLLCDMLEVNQKELAEMGEKGQLSFALIKEALERLGGQGGQYFGLIEKQSKTLDGVWSTLTGNIRLLATEFGELIIPELTKYLSEVIAKLDEMKASGELQEYMRSLADMIKSLAENLIDLAKFIYENKDTLLATGKLLVYYMILGKIHNALTGIYSISKTISTQNFSLQHLRTLSPTLRYLTADLKNLRKVSSSLRITLNSLSAAIAVAFTGWEIGRKIGEMLKLEEVFTRMILKAQGMSDAEIDEITSGKAGKVEPVQLNSEQEFEKAKKQLEDVRKKRNELLKEAQELEALRNKTPKIVSTGNPYIPSVPNGRYEEVVKNLTGVREKLKQIGKEEISLQAGLKNYQKKAAEERAKVEERERAESEAEKIEAARKKAEAERRAKEQKKILEKKREIAREEKEIARDRQSLSDEIFKDSMSQKIQKWQDELGKYQKQIDDTERKLQRFGASVDDNLLKSKDEIRQERKDDLLRKKIDSYNRGAKVRFSEEERARIAELQAEQKKARAAKEQMDDRKKDISLTEKKVKDLDELRKKQGWRERAASLQARAQSAAAARKMLNNINPDKKPVSSYLEEINNILKTRLPAATV